MKTKQNKINISVNFFTEKELVKLLLNISKEYKDGYRNVNSNGVKWNAHPKYKEEELDREIRIHEMVNQNIKFKERDGVTYMNIPSKLNFM